MSSYFDISKQYKALDRFMRETLVQAGKIWYVHGFAGLDTNSGRKATIPLKTIDYALSKVEDDRDDYIIVLDCWNQEDSWPIVVDKQRVHLIGLDMGCGFPRMQAPGDVALFNLTKDYVEIAGFGLDVPSQTTAHGVIEVKTAAVGRCNIHHNFIGCFGASYNAIVLAEGPEAHIHHNLFGAGLAGKGIVGQSTRGRFNYNSFKQVPGINIHLTAGEFAEMIGNRFALYADADGQAITMASPCTGGGIVDDNRAAYLATAVANAPFRDLGATKANWGINYIDKTATLPKTT